MVPMKPKILIVDDKIENLLTLEAVLGDFDADFIRALSGEDALALCLENDFALAIIDIQMPEMDGYETVQIMRQIKRTRNLPIIYVSAIYKEEIHVEKGIETGAVDFIPKPIPPKIIRGKVKIFLELYQYRVQLETMVEERTRQLNEANEELKVAKDRAEKAAESKSAFLATMSHEIRTPLNGIIGMTHLLQSTPLNEKQQELMDIITVSGDNLLGIINDILDYSRIESRKIELEEIPFNLFTVVDEVIKMLKVRADEKNIRLIRDMQKPLPENVVGDSLRLKQILINLVGNAIKFTEAGSVTVRARLIEHQTGEIKIRFSVIDTGIGISDDGIKKLFKEFSQVDASTSRNFGGSGLGLAISKHLTSLMGGEIGVESTPGKGSEFWFTLCLRQGEESLPKENEEPDFSQHPDFESLRVLLVEDNYINQKVARYTLDRVGVRCDVVEDGKSAVDMFVKNQYDVILLDLMLPVMDGFEAARHIRAFEKENPGSKPVKIVAMTANALHEDREQCLACEMDDFISKPFNVNDLYRVLVAS